MRRLTITLTAALVLLAIGPAGAAARHHRRHHSRIHHARIERFGRDASSTQTSPTSSDTAGTVQSFNNGVLTIMLNDHSTASGTVNGDTEMECMAPAQTGTVQEDGDSGSGDQTSGSEDQTSGSEDQTSGSEDQTSGSEDQTSGSEDQTSGSGDQTDTAEQNDQSEDQNETQAEDQNENEAGNNCSTTNLTPGTVVRGAELRISSTGSAWKKVELGS